MIAVRADESGFDHFWIARVCRNRSRKCIRNNTVHVQWYNTSTSSRHSAYDARYVPAKTQKNLHWAADIDIHSFLNTFSSLTG